MSRVRPSKYAGYGLAATGAILALAYVLWTLALKALVGLNDSFDFEIGDGLD